MQWKVLGDDATWKLLVTLSDIGWSSEPQEPQLTAGVWCLQWGQDLPTQLASALSWANTSA